MSKIVYIGIAGSGMYPYLFEVEEDTDLIECMLPYHPLPSGKIGVLLPDGRELARPLGKDVKEDDTVWITDHSGTGGGGVFDTIIVFLVSFSSIYQALAIAADQWKQRRILFWTFPKKGTVKSISIVMDDGQKIVLDDRKTKRDRLSAFLHIYANNNTTMKPKQVIFQFYDKKRLVCNVTTKEGRDEAKKLLRYFSEDQ